MALLRRLAVHAPRGVRTLASPAPRDELDLSFNNPKDAFKSKKTSELVRAYLVYQICSVNWLVENNAMSKLAFTQCAKEIDRGLVRLHCAAQSFHSTSRQQCSVYKPPCFCDFKVKNEPILQYKICSPERTNLISEIKRINCSPPEYIPIVVGGQMIYDGKPRNVVMPHDHQRVIARYHYASENTISRAIQVATQAQAQWDRTPLETRANIMMCAADRMATTYRQYLNAATMAGQSKTVIQAEIDSACELIDFFRFNALFLKEICSYQPLSPKPAEIVNSMRLRGIDGFVASISPFNFTAIAGNLAYTPAMMGNAVLWKPSDTALLSNWRIFNIMREAGIPDGVVNFIPADGPTFGQTITSHPLLAAINFTGSVPTFNWLWNQVGRNLQIYQNYPKLIGEVGGKNYHFVHRSADVETAVACTVRSAFEYCGQKCSACSRLYIPRSLHSCFLCRMMTELAKLKVGSPTDDFSTFMGAVIDANAYNRIVQYIEKARNNPCNKIHYGGLYNASKGYFICPTVIETTNPIDALMQEEIFGPVLTIYTYEDNCLYEMLERVGPTTKFALTGAVFARDRQFLEVATEALKMTCGNFYVNDKSTGAVVNQQPFGGGRMSGTNDKAGAPFYLMRFTSPQAIKQTFLPQRDICYPYMSQ